MKSCRVIKHTISIEYTCPEKGTKHSVKIENPSIQDGEYFEDWTYKYLEIKCKECGKYHSFEI